MGTPFARWIENDEEDPHGDFYIGDMNKLRMANVPSEILAEMLILRVDYSSIAILTAGKERLRWLSRKLYRLTNDHAAINEKRATLLNGQMTDDELANAFYLSESSDNLHAGRQRMKWLIEEIVYVSNPQPKES